MSDEEDGAPDAAPQQRRLRQKRPRLDLCALHGIKNTAMQKAA
jgi:hypothetical protein